MNEAKKMPDWMAEIQTAMHAELSRPSVPIAQHRASLWRLLDTVRDDLTYIARQYGEQDPSFAFRKQEEAALEWAIYALRHEEAGGGR